MFFLQTSQGVVKLTNLGVIKNADTWWGNRYDSSLRYRIVSQRSFDRSCSKDTKD